MKTKPTTKQEEKLVRECYENFPEASASLVCIDWKYKKFKFIFQDEEDGVKYSVNLDDAIRGLRLFIKSVDDGKLPGLGLSAGYLSDTGEWDADAFDALNQMAVFGEVVYG